MYEKKCAFLQAPAQRAFIKMPNGYEAYYFAHPF
jgi:hypothetical protein